MRVFFKDGVIIEGHRAAVKRAIKAKRQYDGPIPYRFSRPWEPSEWIRDTWFRKENLWK